MTSSGAGPLMITGASGFVGANLCRYFADRGAPVVALTGSSEKSSEGPWRLRGLSIEKVAVDLGDRAAVRELVKARRPSFVLNCAAYGAHVSQTDPDRIYRVNFEGVRHLLEALRGSEGFQGFVQAGSSSEYGTNCTAPGEDAPTRPDSDYAVAKLAATKLIGFYGLKHGFPAWVLRLYAIYGPLEDASRLMPQVVAAAAEGHLPAFGNPEVSRDFVSVDDAARAFALVLDRVRELKPGGIYNIGAGRKVTIRELAETARQTFGIAEEPRFGQVSGKHWDHRDWYADPRKAGRELGWKATTSLADGLRAALDWRKRHPELAELSRSRSVTGTPSA